MKLDELKKVQNEVNRIVNGDEEVYTLLARLDDAKKINGLRAMFSEVSFISGMLLLLLFNRIPKNELIII